MSFTAQKLLESATVFQLGLLKVGNRRSPIIINKKQDGYWITAVLGPMNPWHLGTDMVWRYKSGSAFPSLASVVDALTLAENGSIWYGDTDEESD